MTIQTGVAPLVTREIALADTIMGNFLGNGKSHHDFADVHTVLSF